MKTLISLLLLLSIISCGTPDPSIGITTIPNKLNGNIVNASGNSAANVIVYLYGYTNIALAKSMTLQDKQLLEKDTTDNNGLYNFNINSMGTFNILSISRDSTEVLYKEDVYFDPNITTTFTDTIKKAASIFGTIDTSLIDITNEYFISIENTPFIVTIDSTGLYRLPIVPRGSWSIKFTEQDTSNKIQKSVIIKKISVSTSSEIIIKDDYNDSTETEFEDEEYDDELGKDDDIILPQ